MGIIDGLNATREAAAGSPTLVGSKLRSANSLDAILVTRDDTMGDRRAAFVGTFAAGVAAGCIVATAAFLLRPNTPAAPQIAAFAAPPAVRAAPLAPVAEAVSGSVAGPDLQIGMLADAERTLEARGVRVLPVSAREAAALKLDQGPQAFRVANVAAGVTAVAPDDIVVGACGATGGASGAEALEVCIVRDGKLLVARF